MPASAPAFRVKYSSSKKAWQDRKRLPEMAAVFAEDVKQCGLAVFFFPYASRFIAVLLADSAKIAGIEKKGTARILAGYVCCTIPWGRGN
jgi:hypothetical protein